MGEGGTNPKRGVPTFYLANFPHNCMKMENFWPRGGRVPPGSDTGQYS